MLGIAFGLAEGIVVDTHVQRVAERLGLSSQKDPAKVEQDVCALLPPKSWTEMSHRLLLHGRYVCRGKQPACATCALSELCPAAHGEGEGKWTARADKTAARFA